MSRRHSRARNRRALRAAACAEFERDRENPADFAALLKRLAASDLSVWAVARLAARAKPLDEAERAMIAHVVAPDLAGMTPGFIRRRALQQCS